MDHDNQHICRKGRGDNRCPIGLTYNKEFAEDVLTVNPPIEGAEVRAENMAAHQIKQRVARWKGRALVPFKGRCDADRAEERRISAKTTIDAPE